MMHPIVHFSDLFYNKNMELDTTSLTITETLGEEDLRRELTRACYRQIERFEPKIQAFITVIPLTPGGLGFEPVLSTALELKGFAGGTALAMTGLYRTISYLSLVVGGSLVYLLSKKTK